MQATTTSSRSPDATSPLTARGSSARQAARLLLLGGLLGLAWAASLRAFMTEVAGDESTVTWVGTFAWVLAPGVGTGLLLGWAEHQRRGGQRRRWLASAPLLFMAVLLVPPSNLVNLFEDAIGGGAIAVPLFGMAGGYALSPGGPRWARALCALLALSAVPAWAWAAPMIDAGLALDTPLGLWVALLYWSLLAALAVACAIPHRPAALPKEDR